MNKHRFIVPAAVFLVVTATLLFVLYPAVPNEKPSGKLRKKERIRARALQEIQMTKDPALGYVPDGRREIAQDYLKALIAKRGKGGPAKAAIAGVNWTNQGPTNKGGRVRAIMFDPNDSNHERVFAGGVSGGLWKNEDITDANSSWTKINDFLPNLTVTSIVYDPQNTSIFYASTGEAYSSVTPGGGIFRSTDAGATWSLVANSTMFKYISEMKVRVESGTSVLYVASKATYIGEPLADPSEDGYIGVDGLYRTDDNGTTWAQVLPNADGSPGYPPTVDEIEIAANGHLWASTGSNQYGQKGGDIYTCNTGCDDTMNWTLKYDASADGYNDIDRTVIALAPSDANYIYAVAAKDFAGNEDVGYFIKSTDGGTTWSSLTIPKVYDIFDCLESTTDDFTNGQGTYDLAMTVHPTNKDLVVMGAIDAYRTLDGFANTSLISVWDGDADASCPNASYADHHAFVWRPGHPDEVLIGNDGGIYYSTDLGDAAEAKPSYESRVKDLIIAQCYAADISPTAGLYDFIAGMQDLGTQEWDLANGTATTEANGGDGGFCHIDQDQPDLQIAAYIHNDFAVTTNNWASRSQVSPTTGTGRFINPTDYDDTNNILYAASDADEICRVLNIGTTNDLTDKISIGGAGLGGSQATTFRVDRNTPTTLYVGTDDGKVFKILNANGGSLSSTDISTGLPSNTWVSSIDVQKGNSSHMLVTLSNFGTTSVWESTDGGNTWTSVEGNLPDIPVRWGVFSPANSDQAFLATDMGVWSTDNLNGGSTDWGVTNTGLANVRCDMIQYRESDNTLIVATFGRGIYTFTLPSISDKFVAISNLRLQGAMPSSGTTMKTDINGLLPLNDPYGLGVTASSVPANAVDWVMIELRTGLTPMLATTVSASTAAFLLSDGSVKAVDGQDVKFNAVADGNYYLSVRHRNHLGVMTNGTISLTAGTASVDLSSVGLWSNILILANAPATTVNGVRALWGGDANGNGTVSYNGGTNDRDAILAEVDFDILNEDLTYQSEDINFNGITSYNGGSNDRDVLLQLLGFSISAELNEHLP